MFLPMGSSVDLSFLPLLFAKDNFWNTKCILLTDSLRNVNTGFFPLHLFFGF